MTHTAFELTPVTIDNENQTVAIELQQLVFDSPPQPNPMRDIARTLIGGEVASRWQTRARCIDEDPDALFPTSPAQQSDAAARICRPCPVRRQCLLTALNDGIEYGVWGATERERRKFLRDYGHTLPVLNLLLDQKS